MKTFRDKYTEASEQRIYDWAKTVGLPIDAVVKTAILAELRTMYDVGYGEGHNDCMVELSGAD